MQVIHVNVSLKPRVKLSINNMSCLAYAHQLLRIDTACICFYFKGNF